jgi:hypothetical protein
MASTTSYFYLHSFYEDNIFPYFKKSFSTLTTKNAMRSSKKRQHVLLIEFHQKPIPGTVLSMIRDKVFTVFVHR